MKVSVISDLHLEHYPDFTLYNHENAEVLILAGDIVIAEDLKRFPFGVCRDDVDSHRYDNVQRYLEFFTRASELFEWVVFVPGNHEFYGGEYKDSLEVLKRELGKFDNVRVLHDEVFRLPGYSFVGSTLWTDMDNANPMTMFDADKRMNDHKTVRIKNGGIYERLTPRKSWSIHQKSKKFIMKNVEAEYYNGQHVVVVTHHSPSFHSCNPAFQSSVLNGAYMSKMDDIVSNSGAVLWVHGHIHYASDYMIGNTRVFCNPHGYRNELWMPEIKTIEI